VNERRWLGLQNLTNTLAWTTGPLSRRTRIAFSSSAISSDGKRAAPNAERSVPPPNNAIARGAAWSPDGMKLAASRVSDIQLWCDCTLQFASQLFVMNSTARRGVRDHGADRDAPFYHYQPAWVAHGEIAYAWGGGSWLGTPRHSGSDEHWIRQWPCLVARREEGRLLEQSVGPL